MNCVVIDDDKLSRTLIDSYISRTEFLTCVGVFSNGINAINAINKSVDPIDLIFLDIEMPEMDGVEFLRSLKIKAQVIIISAQEQYALQAFEYDVVDYLLKPITYCRFYKAVNKAHERFRISGDFMKDRNEIFIKTNSSLVRLNYNDIIWIEALENYVVVNTKSEKYTIHFTMKAIEDKLPSVLFTRIHRSYIVNISKINMIEDNCIEVSVDSGIKSLPIGKSYKDRLMSDINLMTR